MHWILAEHWGLLEQVAGWVGLKADYYLNQACRGVDGPEPDQRSGPKKQSNLATDAH